MSITVITLSEVADLIEASTITRHEVFPEADRLDMTHPQHGPITTIQAGDEVFLIKAAE